MREKQTKAHTADAPPRAAVDREAAAKPTKESGRSVDKADPYPGLRRRALFREKVAARPGTRNCT